MGEARPITSYPPLLPAVLASLERVGLNPHRSYLAMNMVLLAATVGLAGVIVYRGAGGGARPTAAPLAGGAEALILAGSTDLLQAHAFLWTVRLCLNPARLGAALWRTSGYTLQDRDLQESTEGDAGGVRAGAALPA